MNKREFIKAGLVFLAASSLPNVAFGDDLEDKFRKIAEGDYLGQGDYLYDGRVILRYKYHITDNAILERELRKEFEDMDRFYATLSDGMKKYPGIVELNPTCRSNGIAHWHEKPPRVELLHGFHLRDTAFHEFAHVRHFLMLDSDRFSKAWEEIAGDVYGKFNEPNFWDRIPNETSETGWWKHGLISTYSTNPNNYRNNGRKDKITEDVATLVGSILENPQKVKEAMKYSERFSKKIDLLRKHDFLTEAQYQSVIA